MYRNLLFEHPYDVQLSAFFNTPLGELYQAIPFDSLSKQVGLPRRSISEKGCKPWFDVKGGIALQILKSCYRCSDAMLIEQLRRQLADANVLRYSTQGWGTDKR